MTPIIKNIANLIKVKTFITAAVVTTFMVMSLRGDISPDHVTTITSSVIAFYFGTQHERKDQL